MKANKSLYPPLNIGEFIHWTPKNKSGWIVDKVADHWEVKFPDGTKRLIPGSELTIVNTD